MCLNGWGEREDRESGTASGGSHTVSGPPNSAKRKFEVCLFSKSLAWGWLDGSVVKNALFKGPELHSQHPGQAAYTCL